MDNYGFTLDAATLSNLNRLSYEHSVIAEERMLELSFAAESAAEAIEELMADGFTVYDALATVSDGVMLGARSVHSDSLENNRAPLSYLLSVMNEIDKASFSGEVARLAARRVKGFSESGFLSDTGIKESFIYVRNAFSDEAYDVFSQEFSDPKVRYAKDFRECISAVVSGECGYCLLPLEEKGGVRLHAVCELIYSADLRISSVTPVFGPLGDADLKYCLVSSGYRLPESRVGDDRYLELRVAADGQQALPALLSVVSYLGHTLYRINTVTLGAEGDERTCYYVVIRDEERDFTPLLTYLTLFLKDVSFVGIYKNLE